jgi:hypothetical protein
MPQKGPSLRERLRPPLTPSIGGSQTTATSPSDSSRTFGTDSTVDPADLTIFLTLWKGWRPIYNHRHVNAAVSMLATYAPGVRVICFTNMPEGVECETRPLPRTPERIPSSRGLDCWRRLWFFSGECAEQFPGWIVNIDLDALIFGPMLPLFTEDEFRIMRGGTGPYNGSLWLHKTGTRTHLWDDLSARAVLDMQRVIRHSRDMKRWIGSDQRWIAYHAPGERRYEREDKVRFLGTRFPATLDWHDELTLFMQDGRAIFFPGSDRIKPWSLTMQVHCPPIYEAYMEHYES